MVKLTTLLNPKLQTICSRCKITYRIEYIMIYSIEVSYN